MTCSLSLLASVAVLWLWTPHLIEYSLHVSEVYMNSTYSISGFNCSQYWGKALQCRLPRAPIRFPSPGTAMKPVGRDPDHRWTHLHSIISFRMPKCTLSRGLFVNRSYSYCPSFSTMSQHFWNDSHPNKDNSIKLLPTNPSLSSSPFLPFSKSILSLQLKSPSTPLLADKFYHTGSASSKPWSESSVLSQAIRYINALQPSHVISYKCLFFGIWPQNDTQRRKQRNFFRSTNVINIKILLTRSSKSYCYMGFMPSSTIQNLCCRPFKEDVSHTSFERSTVFPSQQLYFSFFFSSRTCFSTLYSPAHCTGRDLSSVKLLWISCDLSRMDPFSKSECTGYAIIPMLLALWLSCRKWVERTSKTICEHAILFPYRSGIKARHDF